jgi:glutamate dehydrogenase
MKNLIEEMLKLSQVTKVSPKFNKQNFARFLREFYSENQPKDFSGYSAEDMYSHAKHGYEAFISRKLKDCKIEISNPNDKNAGFKSRFTVINIVADDIAFLVDSIVAHLDAQGIRIKNIIHPEYLSIRNKKGELQSFADSVKKSVIRESLIQLHIERTTSSLEIEGLKTSIRRILETAAVVVRDWRGMESFVKRAADQISNAKKLLPAKEIAEIKDFVKWINDGHFILLGTKEFDIKKDKKGGYSLVEVKGEGYGVFNTGYKEFEPIVSNASFEEVSDSVENPYFIEVLKSRYRSQIHRAVNTERVRIQKISTSGKIIGEFRIIGLFTSLVYHSSITEIPLVRTKINQIIKDSGYSAGSHNHKDLISTLESYPRDELFQASSEDLLANAMGIVSICGRSQVKFFARNDKFKRFVSCLVFIPRERSGSSLRHKVEDYLSKVYNGRVTDSFVQVTESNLVRFHITIRTENSIPEVNKDDVENEIAAISRIWSDDLRDSILARFGDEKSFEIFNRYKKAFSVSYSNRFNARRGAIDISFIEQCLKEDSAVFNLYNSSSIEDTISELKIYSPGQEIMLSEVMPLLESFGFNVLQEQNYQVEVGNHEERKVWIYYFRLNISKCKTPFSEKIKLNFEKTVSLIWRGDSQKGLINKLLVSSHLNWKQIYMLRAYTNYLYQGELRYSQVYIANTLVKYGDLVSLLVRLFEARFTPLTTDREVLVDRILSKINKGLNLVKNGADDAVIRSFLDVIMSTLRTNYYQSSVDGKFKGYMSFKFDCSKVPNLPLPLPDTEIFVHSPRVEAVHLRGGKVARGGLRWSNRPEDFRTEVLGLMKAQMTKNAVIVPVGSKGGFVVKKPMSEVSRDELQQEGIACYKIFLRGILDITDNVVNGKIKYPKNVVRYDEEDPYLVVAADKGTATFSDIANSISADYNFWLGDAFASGGSVGYDHKKMGITAKGAWVSVMRHFREMGLDTQSQDFTCAAVGDLAGDVFGNGMLLSKHIKLVAAFNHMHIFLDPNPSTAKSFSERKRMFNLPRSSWLDYKKSAISKGGGVFERSAKTIKLSPEIREVLEISDKELSPTKLIRAILKSSVDLMWNGGIGTYVKSTDESDADVGDRANDSLRINGNELRCRVVGEGGNLGLTQKGRIEYALNGGKVNTDAMDNSAGVDCSDHEVNIKIALADAMRSKKITLEGRNKILEQMTDEVSHLVLEDNRLQTQRVSISKYQGTTVLGEQAQFLNALEKSGLLNREIEFLPSRKEIEKRQAKKIGLTKPELCVMLAYSKMDIYTKIVASDLVDDDYFEEDLFSYFPKLMQQNFAKEISNHQLRKEIIATQITNFIVNITGISFVNQLCQDTGFGVVEVVRSFVVACGAFSVDKLWNDIENLDGKIDFDVQMQMFLSSNKLLARSVVWLLHNQSKGEVGAIVLRFKKIADGLLRLFPGVLAQDSRDSFELKAKYYLENGIEKKLAERVASMDPAASAFDIAEICAVSNFDLKPIAKIYFTVGTRFSLKWIRGRISELNIENDWQRLSVKTILEDLYFFQMKIAKEIVNFSCNEREVCDIDSVAAWIDKMQFSVERFDSFITELKSQANPDLSIFVVSLNRLKSLVNEA